MIDMVDDSNVEPGYYLNRKEKLKWLMKTYGNDVIRIAYTYLKQKELAEDVTQDVFIKCYEKMDTILFFLRLTGAYVKDDDRCGVHFFLLNKRAG